MASCLCGVRGCDGKQCNPVAFENGQLRQELKLAEEGLANYAQEVERLKKLLHSVHTNAIVPGELMADIEHVLGLE